MVYCQPILLRFCRNILIDSFLKSLIYYGYELNGKSLPSYDILLIGNCFWSVLSIGNSYLSGSLNILTAGGIVRALLFESSSIISSLLLKIVLIYLLFKFPLPKLVCF